MVSCLSEFGITWKIIVFLEQNELPEEDMDVRGGGQAAEQERIVKDDGYGSDNEVDSRNDVSWNAARQPSVKLPMNRSIAAMQAAEEDSSEAAQPSGNLRDPSAEPKMGGHIAPQEAIAGDCSSQLALIPGILISPSFQQIGCFPLKSIVYTLCWTW